MQSTTITTKDPQDGQYLSVVGDTYRLLLTGEQTNNSCAIIDMFIPPNGGPGPHAHSHIQESFYVIEGEVVVRTETQMYTARKGSFVNIPLGGTIHNFKNESDTTAHLLCLVVPAGLEKMFQEIGKPVKAGEFLPLPHLGIEELKHMREIAERYGQEVFPPDYFKK